VSIPINDSVSDRNPTGIVLTQAQKDEMFRSGYWDLAIRYGLQYYVAGRFATAHHFDSVSANLLHHGVELLLKACLAHDDPPEAIRKYGDWKVYRHDIRLLWTEFKGRCAKSDPVVPVPAEFDAIIDGLHAFEGIRYPEKLLETGATISVDIFDVEDPIWSGNQGPEPTYRLKLPQIDSLMGLLFKASHANEDVFLPHVTNEQGLTYYQNVKATLFGRPAMVQQFETIEEGLEHSH
jgi:hypothetical protein